MDKMLFSGLLKFDDLLFLKRVSWDNKWQETDMHDIENAKYNFPYLGASDLAVGIYKKR